jgi:miniconductance mechanosensitive channel
MDQESKPVNPEVVETFLKTYPWVEQVAESLTVLLLAWVAYFLFKGFVVHTLQSVILRLHESWAQALIKNRPIEKLAYLAPILILYHYAHVVPQVLSSPIQNLGLVCMLWILLAILDDLLDTINDIYQEYEVSTYRPIKGYLQILKIVLYGLGILVTIAILLNRSPWYFLSGIGALTAVLLLVFRDTLLSFVAGIQITYNDMIRIGDWIEMPQFNADGDVIDIALHTVQVQNWDKTITAIPTHKFISEAFKNWKGMTEFGGRRISRSIYIDVNSVKACDKELFSRLEKIDLIQAYIQNREAEIQQKNDKSKSSLVSLLNGRYQTNIGIFRAYLREYLRHHPHLNQDMTLLVRQKAPQERGIPIQIYAFTRTTEWLAYEDVQSDIFDHIFASVSEFDLRIFQNPVGSDFRALKDATNSSIS